MAKIDSTVEQINSNVSSDGYESFRMKTPGGWLFWFLDTSTSVPTAPCYVPDPAHEWEPSTTDDD